MILEKQRMTLFFSMSEAAFLLAGEGVLGVYETGECFDLYERGPLWRLEYILLYKRGRWSLSMLEVVFSCLGPCSKKD
jgi:hypothetical protein